MKADLKVSVSKVERTRLLVIDTQFDFVSPRIYHVIKTSLETYDSIKSSDYVMPY